MKKKRYIPLWQPLLVLLFLVMGGIGLMILCAGIQTALHPNAAGQNREQERNQSLLETMVQAQALADAADLSNQVPEPILENVDGITVDLLPQSSNTWGDETLDKVTGIVVHYTANPGTTARQNRTYFASLAKGGKEAASSHFVIDIDGEIIQCVPLDYQAYASNRRNCDTISIECCHPDETGAFTRKTELSLIALLRYLAKGYHLDRDQIIRHFDITGKACPLYYVSHPDEWDKLRDLVFSEG